jgi:hypothetical protein
MRIPDTGENALIADDGYKGRDKSVGMNASVTTTKVTG